MLGAQGRLTTVNFNNLVLFVVTTVILGSIFGAIGLGGPHSEGALALQLGGGGELTGFEGATRSSSSMMLPAT